jgi:hypothetical protein
MRTGFYILLLTVSLFLTPLSAGTLTIPGHKPSEQKQTMPMRGVSMEAVLDDFGEPIQRHEPIGDPPISEWIYSGFRVYFEYETVLHTIDMTTLILPKE